MTSHSTFRAPVPFYGPVHKCTGIAIALIAIGLMSASAFSNDQSSSSTPAASVDPASPLSRAVKAWQDQQRFVHSASFRWTFKSFRPVEEQRRRAEKPAIKRQLKVPVSELRECEMVQERVLAIEGSHARYEQRGTMCRAGSNDCWDEERVSVFDGRKNVRVFPNSFLANDRQSKFRFTTVDIAERSVDIDSANIVPLLFAFRMFDQSLYQPLKCETLKVEPMQGLAGFQGPFVCRAGQLTLTISPLHNFAITKYSLLNHDRTVPLCETTIDYRKDNQGLWIPNSWRNVFLTDKGELRAEETSTMVAARINPQLPSATFELDIPVDSYIMDSRPGEPPASIQLADGKRFPVSPGMRVRQAIELAKATGGISTSVVPRNRPFVWLMGLNVLFVLLISGGLWAYRRRSSHERRS